MQCPDCGFTNADDMNFCGNCAAVLKRSCPSCGVENAPQLKFCGHCGTPLTDQSQSPPAPQKEHEPGLPPASPSSAPLAGYAPEAERRLLTVMFCDLVDSTRLSQQLDPEELRDVVREYQRICAAVIQRFEGHIAQYLGDGLLVYFGYPVAHEDDAQRAVRVSLQIIEAVRTSTILNTRPPQPAQVRIGIHTGEVVVGEMGSGDHYEQLALGDTPNITARLQEVVEPNTVVVSATSYRLIDGLFDCQDLGLHSFHGITTPIRVYRVRRESDAHSRLEVTDETQLTALVGREEEVGILRKRWEDTAEGKGQIVMLSGEAGIGKSRLARYMKDHAAGSNPLRVEVRCSPYYQNSAFFPVIDLLQRLLQIKPDDTGPQKLEKLEQFLASNGLPPPEVVPLWASLLSIPVPADRYPPLTLTPQRQKQKIIESIVSWTLDSAEQTPLLVVVEDLQWADPSTLEVLNLLIDQTPTVHLLVLLTFRLDFSPPWAIRSYMTRITLNRLAHKHVEAIIDSTTADKRLPAKVMEQLLAKTDGVPLFVEELTKMLLESKFLVEHADHYELTGPLPTLAIPTTLQGSLMARLDRLGAVKEVAQLGATLGREFTAEVLCLVSPLEEETLGQQLALLVDAELLYQRGIFPHSRYVFKHALIQEAAYHSLLRSRRQYYHKQIAKVFEVHFPDLVETRPELIAYHYTEAGMNEEALRYWQKAGQQAVTRSANIEAIHHLATALELLTTQPETSRRTQQELDLQTTLGPPMMATKGYTASEVEETYTRAQELCRQIGETPQLFPVLRGLYSLYLLRGQLLTAHEFGKQLLTLAQLQQDPALLTLAHNALGFTEFYLGNVASALEHVEQGVALSTSDLQPSGMSSYYLTDPGVASLSNAALALWLLGYPNKALQRSDQALERAQQLAHPHSRVFATYFRAWLHQFRQERVETHDQAEAALVIAHEQGFPVWVAQGTILQGWALAKQARVGEGIAQIRQGIASWRAMGAELGRPHFLALGAEVYEKDNQVGEGLTALAEALAIADSNHECFYHAELFRLKGELLQRLDVSQNTAGGIHHSSFIVHQSPEGCFRQALDIARQQQAKSLELRAAMSLSRLLQQQGKRQEGHTLLADIYGWFAEGFDTPDLQEARQLLDALEE